MDKKMDSWTNKQLVGQENASWTNKQLVGQENASWTLVG